ncbi:S-adenosyl-L-methionine-dependent methyltransferase [Purpureocillium lilacinum]|nr:S-adenosyl-L-methionine-dependent methyltransferase [Purpureocillium lilacinum]OAQ75938.1 S-adenosyl-L-methionine-dependent methyltransferase [Purpureocillium lilacinum]GJN74837.1 hypothetical protein PLICBS_008930 [Purpureocillium lilacinum]GJN85437.1 hypothetical protein PLIIFM63780_009004 [Purpureocillium lilacinum]
MTDAPQTLVQRGYDEIAETYLKWATQKETPRPAQLQLLFRELGGAASSARVLELGCGAGVPGTQILSQTCGSVVANDISDAQMRLAKTHMAGADNVEFVSGDMTQLAFGDGSLDAVVALYSIIHLPREDQKRMFGRIHAWLRDGGMLLCNLGTSDDEGSVASWLGTQMYWSQCNPEANIRMVEGAGFHVVQNKVIEEEEDGRIIPFQWILARKGEPAK